MSDELEREKALMLLKDLSEATVEPSLEDSELEAILDRQKVAQVWQAGIAVRVGTILYPTVANGRWYQVTKAGVTGATEPAWSQGLSTIIESSVTYQDLGTSRDLYDVQAAAYEAWSKKCAKASQYVSTPGIDMSSIYKRCVEMRESYEQVYMA